MREDLEQLKQRIPLLQYLQRRHWTGCRVAAREEFVGLCPLHRDTRPASSIRHIQHTRARESLPSLRRVGPRHLSING